MNREPAGCCCPHTSAPQGRLSKARLKNPIYDFGQDSRIVEMTIAQYSDARLPTAHHRLVLTIESGTVRRRFAFINPEPPGDLSAMMQEGWAFRILDRNREGERFVEFGRYFLEYMDDEDGSPRHIQADRVEELGEHGTVP